MRRPILRLPDPPQEKPPELLDWSALIVPITIEEAGDIVSSDLSEKRGSWSPNWAKQVEESWADVQSKMTPGDQLWTYQTGPTKREDGIALTRKRRVIAKAMLGLRYYVIPWDLVRE